MQKLVVVATGLVKEVSRGQRKGSAGGFWFAVTLVVFNPLTMQAETPRLFISQESYNKLLGAPDSAKGMLCSCEAQAKVDGFGFRTEGDFEVRELAANPETVAPPAGRRASSAL